MITAESLALLAGRPPRILERDHLIVGRGLDLFGQPVVDIRAPLAGEIVVDGQVFPITLDPGEWERSVCLEQMLRGWGKGAALLAWHSRKRRRDLPPWRRS